MSAPGRLLAVMVLALAALAAMPRGAGADLVTDLSNRLVAITTGFTGTNVLLFGAIEGDGDVVVVVKGPARQKVVRRKARVAGIWVNTAEMVFDNVPGYYAVATSAPLIEIAPDTVRERHEIGAVNVNFTAPADAAPAEVAEFRTALIRRLEAENLYSREPAPIRFLGRRLFRTDVRVPANAPTGVYAIAVYLIRDGAVVGAEITPLTVNKVGFEAGVFDFAHRHSLAYGVLAIIIAVVAGWSASAVFRKG